MKITLVRRGLERAVANRTERGSSIDIKCARGAVTVEARGKHQKKWRDLGYLVVLEYTACQLAFNPPTLWLKGNIEVTDGFIIGDRFCAAMEMFTQKSGDWFQVRCHGAVELESKAWLAAYSMHKYSFAIYPKSLEIDWID